MSLDVAPYISKLARCPELIQRLSLSILSRYRGYTAWVHRTRDSAIKSGSGFTHAKWKETDTFWEALAYMIVKGIEQLMPPVVVTLPPTDPTISSARNSDPVDDLGVVLEVNLRIQTSGALSRPCATTQSSASPQRSVAVPTTHSRTASSRNPIIYSHVRNLRGIIETRYYFTPPNVEQAHRSDLGLHATQYLSAHGYTASAIETIINALNASSSEQNFTLRLSEHGLALAEAQCLWYLIHLQ